MSSISLLQFVAVAASAHSQNVTRTKRLHKQHHCVTLQGVCVRRGDVFLSGQTGLTPAASLVKETGGIPVSASSVVQTPLPTSHVAEKDSKRIRLD